MGRARAGTDATHVGMVDKVNLMEVILYIMSMTQIYVDFALNKIDPKHRSSTKEWSIGS
jgi:hypothetical protein